jgi:hypothetical protein
MINKNNKKFCVYEHLFPNGKRYIGITSKNPEARWENGNGYHQKTQPVMYNAIRKYGWENIKHNILFDNLTEEEAKEKEKELIQEYNTFIYAENPMGYNMTLGGEGTLGHKATDKIKEVNRNRLLGKKGKECCNSRVVLCDGIEYESLNQFCEIMKLNRGKVTEWINGHDTMPKEWYDKQLHYKDTDFSLIKCRENEKKWEIYIDDKCFYSQRDFAKYIQEDFPTVCLWLNQQNPIPVDLLKRGLRVFINNTEIIFSKTRERVLGWEYKGITFNNLRELAEYLNIKKGTLWSYLKNPHWKSAQKYLPLKNIHKIERT